MLHCALIYVIIYSFEIVVVNIFRFETDILGRGGEFYVGCEARGDMVGW